mmetsp:Transcript_5748/g.15570  ORF Transcript_5748/g.15570 Transcript_5748/m.15570 type:complete len:132 (-) Transcript_5748:59-454(-)
MLALERALVRNRENSNKQHRRRTSAVWCGQRFNHTKRVAGNTSLHHPTETTILESLGPTSLDEFHITLARSRRARTIRVPSNTRSLRASIGVPCHCVTSTNNSSTTQNGHDHQYSLRDIQPARATIYHPFE